MTIEEIEEELVSNLLVPADRATKLTLALDNLGKQTVAQIVTMTSQEVQAMAFQQGLTQDDIANFKVILGTLAAPHMFEKKPLPLSSDTSDVSKKKGGRIEHLSAQQLAIRRPRLDPEEYHLPAPFDAHRIGSADRQEDQLRACIVKESQDMCGDLYWDADERKVILDKVTAVCGPPGNKYGSWDNWRDEHGKKHKGTAVNDVERARSNPAKFDVTRFAIEGPRPPRPLRALPPLRKRTSNLARPAGIANDADQTGSGDTGETNVSGGDADANDDDPDLLSTQELVKQVKEAEAKLKAVKEAAKQKALLVAKQRAERRKANAGDKHNAGNKRPRKNMPANTGGKPNGKKPKKQPAAKKHKRQKSGAESFSAEFALEGEAQSDLSDLMDGFEHDELESNNGEEGEEEKGAGEEEAAEVIDIQQVFSHFEAHLERIGKAITPKEEIQVLLCATRTRPCTMPSLCN